MSNDLQLNDPKMRMTANQVELKVDLPIYSTVDPSVRVLDLDLVQYYYAVLVLLY